MKAPGAGLTASARERDPGLVVACAHAAESLRDAGQPTVAGWLLVALVEAELRRPGNLETAARRVAVAAARLLGQGGRGVEGARVALSTGDPALAARLLEAAGRGPAARMVARLPPERRPLGGAVPGLGDGQGEAAEVDRSEVAEGAMTALRLLAGSGDSERALGLAEALGLYREAARICRRLGRPALAAEHWERAGAPLEAGRAWLEAGQDGRALDQLVLVPLDHPRHRAACVLAARVARRTGRLPFELHHLLGPFLRTPPRDEAELLALSQLASLYDDQGMPRAAAELLELALQGHPDRLDLRRRLDALRGALNDPSRDDRLVAQDASFHGRLAERLREAGGGETLPADLDDPLPALPSLPDLDGLPDLPPLPPLPDLPPLPPAAGSPGGAPWGGMPPLAAGAASAPPGPNSDGRSRTLVPDLPAPPGGDRPGPTLVFESIVPVQPTAAPAATFADSLWGGSTTAGVQPSFDAPELPEQPFSVGRIVGERYRIESLLGEGGMGAVFRAHDLELGEDIALKVLTVPVRSRQVEDRFRQELRLARRLTHPNIVRVHDMGVHQGLRYITMELMEGADLRRRLEEGLTLAEALRYVHQAALGLQAAHDRGVVHRDVKPENLFVLYDGDLKVMDFGLARTGDTPTVTVSGMLAGTPAYMAPEQANNFSSAGAAADQYALGVICYEVATGTLPFRHPELLQLLKLHAEQPPIPPSVHRPGLPAALERIILRALEKDPDLRFPSCGALADELKALLPPR